jgi:hypothetical protein
MTAAVIGRLGDIAAERAIAAVDRAGAGPNR